MLGELAKYGANMLLATQSLSRLDRLTDAQRTRNLRASVFSNLDGLFAFHISAEDATYLAEELGGGLDAQDLLELGHYQCYARLTDARTGERLPTFSVQLDPPPESNEHLAVRLARLSAERYARDALDVELDLQSALDGWELLYERSIGCVGIIKDWLTLAMRFSRRQKTCWLLPGHRSWTNNDSTGSVRLRA